MISNVFSHSFSVALRQWRITAIVYFFQLFLALTLGMQAFEVLKASIGHSLEINKLLAHYDHTVITDFLKVHGASITPLIGQLRWLLLVWLIFSVFIDAGLLYCASKGTGSEQATARTFWLGGAEYFFSFLKISLLFLVLALVWTGVILLPIAIFMEPSLEYFATEQYTVWATLFLLLIYLIGLALLFIGSVLSRVIKIKTGASIASCIKKGWQVFWKNKRGFMGLMSGFIGLQIVLVTVYWLLESVIGMTSPLGILVLFVAQQAFVYFRIQIRQMMYAGVGSLAIIAENKIQH
ncbi:MAG: hypothetical protein H7246_06175 [Phycisphaerae bacterium]|nr:hypothetical protein [Saprospiraceae bacterium]